MAVITVLYLGVAGATIATGTYGSPEVDRVAVARLLADSRGAEAGAIAAAMAVIIALGTANAFAAATSRLGYALARDGAFPAPFSVLDRRGVPARAVLLVGGLAAAGLFAAYLADWGPERLVVISSSPGSTAACSDSPFRAFSN